MKNLFKLILISSLFLGLPACTDLEEEIKGDFTEDYDPNNPGVGIKNNTNNSAPQDGLADAFSRVRNGTANHGSYFSVAEISTDEAVITQKGGDWFDGGIWLAMHRHQFSSTSGGINGAWGDLYGAIFQCNDLLDNGLSDAHNAQLRVLRAYFYWKLLDMFGNVKIVTVAGVDAPQSPREDVFDFVEAELLASIPDLPTGKPAYARVSQGTAYALLSRLYLNAEVYTGTQRWQDAIDAADEVINSGDFDLATSYKYLFGPKNAQDGSDDNQQTNASDEMLFIAPFDEATGTGMNLAQMTLHYPSQLTFQLQEQPWNGYSTLEDFYNSYEDTDLRKAGNFIAGPQYDLNGSPILDVAFDQADPDGAPINYTPEINELSPNGSRQAGARFGKYFFKQKQGQNMDNDFPLLRYAEVLLNKAEAVARLNNDFSHATTLSLVNQIRTRADVSTYGSLTEGELLAERGRELFLESLRRTDLIRFGAWGDAWWEKPAHADAYKVLMAIPQEQINLAATFPLTQNPGY